ncbi:IclR family transcriptional regulator [Brevibacillus daliensis]|uniref:IclR family transcriptional regulator n=1 Tax=Brevibacillus daliensis TaxID=2892995 RepID=UPI001E47DEC0|nr:IclR family transcriptional regulator [Brevibacillus daliensis]
MDNLLSSVKNSCRVLKFFLESPKELGVTEISKKLSLSKSAVHKMLATLESEGFIQQNQKTKQYMLGYTLLELGNKVLRDHDIVEYAKPHLQELANSTKELVSLCIRDGNDAIYVDKIDSQYTIRFNVDIYRRFPLYATCAARAILAFQPDSFIDSILASPLKEYTSESITEAQDMKKRLLRIRQNGYEVSSNMRNIGVTGIAAPIYDVTSQVVCSISLIGPTDRMIAPLDSYREKVQQTAKILSEGLGYHNN